MVGSVLVKRIIILIIFLFLAELLIESRYWLASAFHADVDMDLLLSSKMDYVTEEDKNRLSLKEFLEVLSFVGYMPFLRHALSIYYDKKRTVINTIFRSFNNGPRRRNWLMAQAELGDVDIAANSQHPFDDCLYLYLDYDIFCNAQPHFIASGYCALIHRKRESALNVGQQSVLG